MQLSVIVLLNRRKEMILFKKLSLQLSFRCRSIPIVVSAFNLKVMDMDILWRGLFLSQRILEPEVNSVGPSYKEICYFNACERFLVHRYMQKFLFSHLCCQSIYCWNFVHQQNMFFMFSFVLKWSWVCFEICLGLRLNLHSS